MIYLNEYAFRSKEKKIVYSIGTIKLREHGVGL